VLQIVFKPLNQVPYISKTFAILFTYPTLSLSLQQTVFRGHTSTTCEVSHLHLSTYLRCIVRYHQSWRLESVFCWLATCLGLARYNSRLDIKDLRLTWALWLETWRHRRVCNCFRGYRRIMYIYTKNSLRQFQYFYIKTLAPWPLPVLWINIYLRLHWQIFRFDTSEVSETTLSTDNNTLSTNQTSEEDSSEQSMIMRPHRSRLSDQMLSNLIFLKCNTINEKEQLTQGWSVVTVRPILRCNITLMLASLHMILSNFTFYWDTVTWFYRCDLCLNKSLNANLLHVATVAWFNISTNDRQ